MTPFSVKDKENDRTIPVPCGKCPNCVARRTSAWSFRLMQQEKVSSSAHFITITYDTNYVPITDSGYMSLNFRDCQLFLKRLRKAHSKETRIKYYLVGEYGGKTNRPHYHALLYDVEINKIQNAWQKGQIHYGQVTAASIGYTLKYMSKPKKIPVHAKDDRVPEKSLMSKGLGLNYLSSEIIKWHKNDLLKRMYLSLNDGRKVSMPRYYKDKLYTKAERNMIGEIANMERIIKQLEDIEKIGKEKYWHNKAENDRAAFERMAKNYLKNQKLF